MFVMPCTPGAVDGGENAAQRCEVDVMINTNAEYVVAIVIAQLDISYSHGIRAVGNGVLLIVYKGETIHLLAVDGIKECVDGAVALTGYIKVVSVCRSVPQNFT